MQSLTPWRQESAPFSSSPGCPEERPSAPTGGPGLTLQNPNLGKLVPVLLVQTGRWYVPLTWSLQVCGIRTGWLVPGLRGSAATRVPALCPWAEQPGAPVAWSSLPLPWLLASFSEESGGCPLAAGKGGRERPAGSPRQPGFWGPGSWAPGRC